MRVLVEAFGVCGSAQRGSSPLLAAMIGATLTQALRHRLRQRHGFAHPQRQSNSASASAVEGPRPMPPAASCRARQSPDVRARTSTPQSDPRKPVVGVAMVRCWRRMGAPSHTIHGASAIGTNRLIVRRRPELFEQAVHLANLPRLCLIELVGHGPQHRAGDMWIRSMGGGYS